MNWPFVFGALLCIGSTVLVVGSLLVLMGAV